MPNQYPQTVPTGGAVTLAPNDVWNIPDTEDRGTLKTHGPWRIAVSFRAVAIDSDGYVYGERTLTNVRESGYVLEGRVSIDGRKYRGFTSSALFERPDGSLVSVATIHVCTPDGPIPLPNLDTATDVELKTIVDRYHYCREGSRAAIRDYARMVQHIRNGDADRCPWAYGAAQLAELRAALPAWAPCNRD